MSPTKLESPAVAARLLPVARFVAGGVELDVPDGFAAEGEPVRQIFVDDVGRRRRSVLTVVAVAKLAVVLFAVFVAVGLGRALLW